jgi:hypothetical protein
MPQNAKKDFLTYKNTTKMMIVQKLKQINLAKHPVQIKRIQDLPKIQKK